MKYNIVMCWLLW